MLHLTVVAEGGRHGVWYALGRSLRRVLKDTASLLQRSRLANPAAWGDSRDHLYLRGMDAP
ncbi:MAG: hypothetical protein K9L28_10470 [Synergistales bacterium]|nr:hypothetical protein [Synergistales bacterium]